jgi:hypothetical protein
MRSVVMTLGAVADKLWPRLRPGTGDVGGRVEFNELCEDMAVLEKCPGGDE